MKGVPGKHDGKLPHPRFAVNNKISINFLDYPHGLTMHTAMNLLPH